MMLSFGKMCHVLQYVGRLLVSCCGRCCESGSVSGSVLQCVGRGSGSVLRCVGWSWLWVCVAVCHARRTLSRVVGLLRVCRGLSQADHGVCLEVCCSVLVAGLRVCCGVSVAGCCHCLSRMGCGSCCGLRVCCGSVAGR